MKTNVWFAKVAIVIKTIHAKKMILTLRNAQQRKYAVLMVI